VIYCPKRDFQSHSGEARSNFIGNRIGFDFFSIGSSALGIRAKKKKKPTYHIFWDCTKALLVYVHTSSIWSKWTGDRIHLFSPMDILNMGAPTQDVSSIELVFHAYESFFHIHVYSVSVSHCEQITSATSITIIILA
jgi:hypothetical protein